MTASQDPAAFAIPAGACDCHTHVFLDPRTHPFAPDRKYTPPVASTEDLQALMAGLGLERVVIVQPSVYGLDNTATLAGIRAIGLHRARGVAVIDAGTGDAELDRLAGAGVRGVRVNLELAGEHDPQRAARLLEQTARQIAGQGWHVQIYAQLALIAALRDTIARLPVPVVLDHFGGATAAGGPGQDGLAAVLELVRAGQVWVKLSAAYRCSTRVPDYPDMQALARGFIAANPGRMLWGSDWPHPDPARPPGTAFADLRPPLPVDDARVFGLLRSWAGDAGVFTRILRDNPAQLYGF